MTTTWKPGDAVRWAGDGGWYGDPAGYRGTVVRVQKDGLVVVRLMYRRANVVLPAAALTAAN